MSAALIAAGALPSAAAATTAATVSGQGLAVMNGQTYSFSVNVSEDRGAANSFSMVGPGFVMRSVGVIYLTPHIGNNVEISGTAINAQGQTSTFTSSLSDRANPNGAGQDTFSIFNGRSGSLATLSLGNILVSTHAVNAAPVAQGDSYTVVQGSTLTVNAPGVLANDTDSDRDVLIVHPGTGPAHGALKLISDGSFTYTPAAGYNGPDSFTYTAYDTTTDSATATVAINVLPPAPQAQDDGKNLREGDSVTGNVLANDSGTGLQVAAVSGRTIAQLSSASPVTVQGQYGTLTIARDGTYTYTANSNPTQETTETLRDVFNYSVTDSAGRSSRTTLTMIITGHIPPTCNCVAL